MTEKTSCYVRSTEKYTLTTASKSLGGQMKCILKCRPKRKILHFSEKYHLLLTANMANIGNFRQFVLLPTLY